MLNPRKPTTSFHTTTKNTDSQRQRESTTVHNSTTRRDERPDRRYRAEENHTRQKNHNNSKPKSPIPKAPHSTSHTQAHSAYLSQREATCEWRASAGGRWSWGGVGGRRRRPEGRRGIHRRSSRGRELLSKTLTQNFSGFIISGLVGLRRFPRVRTLFLPLSVFGRCLIALTSHRDVHALLCLQASCSLPWHAHCGCGYLRAQEHTPHCHDKSHARISVAAISTTTTLRQPRQGQQHHAARDARTLP